MIDRGRQLARRLTIVALAAASGCATVEETALVNGVEVPRPTLRFTGQPYELAHYRAHPLPGGPSDGLIADGGWIGGQVCRDNVLYFVEHHGEHVFLEGFVGGRGGSWLVVRDIDGGRAIKGRSADLTVTSAAIRGTYADHPVELSRQGKRLVGHLGEHKMVVRGIDALWTMPAADQAVLLDELMRCDSEAMRLRGRDLMPGRPSPMVFGLGGPDTTFPVDDP